MLVVYVFVHEIRAFELFHAVINNALIDLVILQDLGLLLSIFLFHVFQDLIILRRATRPCAYG